MTLEEGIKKLQTVSLVNLSVILFSGISSIYLELTLFGILIPYVLFKVVKPKTERFKDIFSFYFYNFGGVTKSQSGKVSVGSKSSK